jgi:hypothetical protein
MELISQDINLQIGDKALPLLEMWNLILHDMSVPDKNVQTIC